MWQKVNLIYIILFLQYLEAYNLFYYLSYEGAADIDSIEDELEKKAIIIQIKNFGVRSLTLEVGLPYKIQNQPYKNMSNCDVAKSQRLYHYV